MKALEVLVNGEVVGLYVPPEGECFSAVVANVPRTYMRAQVMSGTKTEAWYWQLPDIREGETIAFRLVEADGRSGVPPQRKVRKDRERTKNLKQVAAKTWDRAKKEMKKKKSSSSRTMRRAKAARR